MLAALANDLQEVSDRAVKRILSLRNDSLVQAQACDMDIQMKKKKKCSFKKQRPFVKQDLNFQPPYTKTFTDEEIESYKCNPLQLDLTSHSVITERTIRDITSVAQHSTSEEKKDGMIRALHKHRKTK